MSTIATSTTPKSREAALVRLAEQARTSGVRLYQDLRDGRFYASSRSQPGTYHRLTAWTCTCRGFVHYQRCAHLAALHSALGWLELEDPNPTPSADPVSTTCPDCQGTGAVTGTIGRGQTWRYDDIVCPLCHGLGIASETAA